METKEPRNYDKMSKCQNAWKSTWKEKKKKWKMEWNEMIVVLMKSTFVYCNKFEWIRQQL